MARKAKKSSIGEPLNQCCKESGNLNRWDCGCSWGCDQCSVKYRCKVCEQKYNTNVSKKKTDI